MSSMAVSELPTAEVKPQASPSVQPSHVVTMIPISDSAPLGVPLRTLSAQQMALVLQQGRQNIVDMYDEKDRLGQEIASAQGKLGTLSLEISFETEKSMTRAKEVKALTQEKHLLEQEIAGFKEEVQLLSNLTKEKRQFMQEMRTVSSAKDKLLLEVQVLKDEKHQIEREMPGAKALQDKLSQKTLAANAEYNQLGQRIAKAKAEHNKVTQENLRVVRDVKRANAKKDIVEQEIQLVEKERERLLQDILEMKPAVMTNTLVGASNDNTDQKANSYSTTDLSKAGQAFSMTPMIFLAWVVLFGFLVTRFPIFSFTAICAVLWLWKL